MSNNDADVDFFEEEDAGTGAEKFKASITNLAREARVIEGEIATLQTQIRDLTARKTEILTRKLPDALNQAGVSEITTTDGLKVSKKYVVGSIPADSKATAYEYLDSHGHSGIIKRNLALQFSKGDTKQAEAAKDALKQMGFEPTIKLDIHPQTWMAFAREQIQNGKMLPFDQWGVFHGDQAQIK